MAMLHCPIVSISDEIKIGVEMNRILKYASCFVSLVLAVFLLVSCSAVFEGGASGKVVDAESTETPKTGIQDVEVYVYTSEYQRNEDFRIYNGFTTGMENSIHQVHHI